MNLFGFMNDWFWPTAEVRQDQYRGAGMRAEAAGRVIRGIISATDPKRPVALIVNIPMNIREFCPNRTFNESSVRD